MRLVAATTKTGINMPYEDNKPAIPNPITAEDNLIHELAEFSDKYGISLQASGDLNKIIDNYKISYRV